MQCSVAITAAARSKQQLNKDSMMRNFNWKFDLLLWNDIMHFNENSLAKFFHM